MKNTPIAGRWLEKVAVSDLASCWLWQGLVDQDGYGKFQYPTDNGQVHIRAHRWAYQHFIGSIPTGLHVLHICDTPSCVNPNHLWLGTNQDNVDDRQVKGRGVKVWGEPLNRLRQDNCKRGHPLSGSNLGINPKTGWRRCKRCAADRAMVTYWKKKGGGTDGSNVLYR